MCGVVYCMDLSGGRKNGVIGTVEGTQLLRNQADPHPIP